MSDFSLSLEQRKRLLAGDYSPLLFDTKPFGCKPGARYVLVWQREQRNVIKDRDGNVVKDENGRAKVAVVPAMPLLYITASTVQRRPDGRWLVRHDVSDYRDQTVWLAPGGGYQTSRRGSPDSRPVVVDESVRAKVREEFWHQRRLAVFAAEQRARSRARRQRRAA